MASGDSADQGPGAELDGRLLGGRYRVTGRIGRGGMGVVCRAVDEVLGREVAVKVLRAYTDAAASELADMRARMQREARAAARIRNPRVITVHDVLEEGGRPVIVMELIDGPSLDGAMTDDGAMEPGAVAAIGAEVADALDAAHAAGVLHRDVKPGNVLLDRSGRVVLTDFGIASIEAPDDGADSRLTRSGELVGSLDYMPPERAQGAEPDKAADIWALGMTLYAAVEGSAPFRRTSVWSTLSAIISEPLPEPQRAGPLEPVLRELLSKEPEQRPTAARARDLLRAVAAGSPEAAGAAAAVPAASAAAPPAGGSAAPGGESSGAVVLGSAGQGQTPPGRTGRRRKAVPAAVVAAVVVIAGGAAYAVLGNDGGDPEAGGDRTPTASATRDGAEHGGEAAPERTRKAKPSPEETPSATRGGGAAGAPDNGTDDGGTGGADSGGSSGSDGGADGGASSVTGGGTGGSDSGGTGGDSGGGDPPGDPCVPAGTGAYSCTVLHAAPLHTRAGAQAGTIGAGPHRFACQANFGKRETAGGRTSSWVAKVAGGASGDPAKYVNLIHLEGSVNDAPMPDMATCRER
ncbi:serine/threonine protein kinase [Streptomyces armeniacus]|uniref:non-specific serine/threonine protein kinase n=1 Tax=Streptomyces armeniacus TaxID=83291 RepID=A0A345XK37_9ACTN|nr:serine/threonine-protein kinase [Streptomyces armeniacus]AXK32003.1 serine/threonine protein kinase [Streptomyces armeniacus]